MAFTVTFATDNATFADCGDGSPEVAATVSEVASRVRSGERSGTVCDFNGHPIGTFEYVPDH